MSKVRGPGVEANQLAVRELIKVNDKHTLVRELIKVNDKHTLVRELIKSQKDAQKLLATFLFSSRYKQKAGTFAGKKNGLPLLHC